MKRGVKKTKKNFNIRKTIPFRILIICVILLIVLLLIWVGLKINEREEKELEGELGDMKIFAGFQETEFLRANCSDENLKRKWNYLLNESSENITIRSDKNVSSGEELCNISLMYKIKENNLTYFIITLHEEDRGEVISYAWAFFGNFSDNFMYQLQNPYLNEYNELMSFLENIFYDFYYDELRNVQGIRNISNLSEAEAEYWKVFKIENSTWNFHNSSYYPFYYGFENYSDSNTKSSLVFSNYTLDLLVYGELVSKPINLTQTQPIPNLFFNGSGSRYVYLDNYFDNLGSGVNLTVNYNANCENLSITSPLGFSYSSSLVVNSGGNVTGFCRVANLSLSHPDWNSGENVFSNDFNISVQACFDSDYGRSYYSNGTTKNSSGSWADYCMPDGSLTEYYCSYSQSYVLNRTYVCSGNYYCSSGKCVYNSTYIPPNNPPAFNSTSCDDLGWEVNTDYKLNMRKCWHDPDGDGLTGFRYANSSSSNKNLSISQNADNLTLSPDAGWVGTGYFYIYVSDGKEESSARIDFEVKNSSASGSTTGSSGSTGGSASSANTSANATNTTASNPKIILSSPRDNEVYIFPGNKTFSITAEKYSNIKWYLNGALVTEAENKLTYEFADLKEGDIVKVEIINGTRLDSKTWNIKIQEDIAGEVSVFDVGEVIFYLIIAIICIIIFLIIWLFFVEKNKGIKTGSGFGISEPESNVKIIGGRDSNLDSLNIPG